MFIVHEQNIVNLSLRRYNVVIYYILYVYVDNAHIEIFFRFWEERKNVLYL